MFEEIFFLQISEKTTKIKCSRRGKKKFFEKKKKKKKKKITFISPSCETLELLHRKTNH
jgi:hypothetical protein